MDIKKLEKAQKIYLKIKDIDKEIIGIEKLAQRISQEDVTLQLKIKEVTEEKNMRIAGAMDWFRLMPGGFYSNEPSEIETITENKREPIKYSTELQDVSVLSLLGCVLQDKQSKRNYYLNKLNELGIQI